MRLRGSGRLRPRCLRGQSQTKQVSFATQHRATVGRSHVAKGRINRDNGLNALRCQTCGKGNRVLLGNADIKITCGELLFKFHQTAAFAHGWRDCHQFFIGSRLVAQPLPEYLGVGGTRLAGYGRVYRRCRLLANRVVFNWVVFGKFVALTFFW